MKNNAPITRNIAKKGFYGMRSSSPASISLYFDSDVLRNPFQAILPPLWCIQYSTTNEITNGKMGAFL
ncbi:MAG: hypothetical protein HC905_29590 [Bacteroidales bacterium]|nr:hypothetical protein [Bacteroidales bacterium]